MAIFDIECDISTVVADACAVKLLAADVGEIVPENEYYKLHAAYALAEHP